MKSKLWVCWLRDGKWVAKPFTGNESWDDLQDPAEYNETVVMVVATTAVAAAERAWTRGPLAFPDVLVADTTPDSA